MSTLIGTLENVADYSSLNGSERLKIDSIEGSLNPNVTLGRGSYEGTLFADRIDISK